MTWWQTKVELLTPTDIARRSRELVAAEKESRRHWERLANADTDSVARVAYLVRDELLRLLVDPSSWLPGSLRPRDGDRLDVTISLDLSEARAGDAAAMVRNEQALRKTLVDLAGRLGDHR
jgi:hypothetical protein